MGWTIVSFVPPFALPRSLDIAAVTTLAAELESALACGALTVDASAVVKLDAAGLQLLCAVAIAAQRLGVQLTWQSVPTVLQAGARTLALSSALGWRHLPAQEAR